MRMEDPKERIDRAQALNPHVNRNTKQAERAEDQRRQP